VIPNSDTIRPGAHLHLWGREQVHLPSIHPSIQPAKGATSTAQREMSQLHKEMENQRCRTVLTQF